MLKKYMKYLPLLASAAVTATTTCARATDVAADSAMDDVTSFITTGKVVAVGLVTFFVILRLVKSFTRK